MGKAVVWDVQTDIKRVFIEVIDKRTKQSITVPRIFATATITLTSGEAPGSSIYKVTKQTKHYGDNIKIFYSVKGCKMKLRPWWEGGGSFPVIDEKRREETVEQEDGTIKVNSWREKVMAWEKNDSMTPQDFLKWFIALVGPEKALIAFGELADPVSDKKAA